MDDTLSGGTSTEPATGNPALAAATAEYQQVMANPAHPHYDGFRCGSKTANDYVDSLYRKALPNTTPVDSDQDMTVTGRDESRSLEDSVAHNEIDVMLRRTFGDQYDTEMGNMRLGAQHLFSIDGGDKVLAEFAGLISGLGPLAEVRGIRFLAEIGQLIKQQQGGRT